MYWCSPSAFGAEGFFSKKIEEATFAKLSHIS
jgi:hypothetical protein